MRLVVRLGAETAGRGVAPRWTAGMTRLEFGVNVRDVESTDGLRALVRRADGFGYDVLALPDHLGGPPPSRRWPRRRW